MSKIVYVLIAVALALICGIGLLGTDDSDDTVDFLSDGYSIQYDNLRGADNSLNPRFYQPGETVELKPVSCKGYRFGGWYLDNGELCMEITPETTGNLKLHAKWLEHQVGRETTYNISGTVKDGIYNGYEVNGERTVTFKHYDDRNGFFVSYQTSLVFDYGYTEYTSEYEHSQWNPSKFFDFVYSGQETIDTMYGRIVCDVCDHNERDYSNRMWIGHDDRVVYKVEESSKESYGNAVFTYTLTKHTVVNVEQMYSVTGYSDGGINVKGSGIFNTGDEVELTATIEDGVRFDGWFDKNLRPLSYSTTLKLTVGWEDIDVYALNSEDPDFEGTTYENSEFDLGTGIEDVSWRVCPYGLPDTEFEGTGDVVGCQFTEPGWYEVFIKDSESNYFGYRTAYVDGMALRDYVWSFEGNNYSTSIWFDYDDIMYYYMLMDIDQRHCMVSPMNKNHDHERSFVTWEDPYIQDLAAEIGDMTSGMTDLQTANFVLEFLGSVEYQSDDVFFGQNDYWKFPVETLYDMGGDCEDTSLLYCAIMKAMGYDTALVLFPNHAMAALSITVDGGDYDYFREDGGARYYYVESTGNNEMFGRLPDVVNIRDEIPIYI